MRLAAAWLVLASLAGCATFVPVADLSKVPPEQLANAAKIPAFMIESGATYPAVASHLGEVTAYSCKHVMTDPPASKGDALKRLRLEALKLQADAIIDVTFDERGTDAFGTNCWETVQATGQAVKLVTAPASNP